MSVQSNCAGSGGGGAFKEDRGCIAEGLHRDTQVMVNYNGPGQDTLMTKRLIVVSLALLSARVHDTAGVHSSEEMIRILRYEHFSLKISKYII